MEVLAAFLAGAALGVGGAYAYFDAWRVWMRDEADRWETARMKEVKDLRAQVARHIGTEATSSVDPTLRHSAPQPAQAERPPTAA